MGLCYHLLLNLKVFYMNLCKRWSLETVKYADAVYPKDIFYINNLYKNWRILQTYDKIGVAEKKFKPAKYYKSKEIYKAKNQNWEELSDKSVLYKESRFEHFVFGM